MRQGQSEAEEPATLDDQDPAEEGRDQQIATLENERALLGDRLLRLAAEFENWKKRSVRERGEAEQRAQENVLRNLIEVVDGLERAIAAMTPDAEPRAVREGLELVLRNLLRRLEAYDVRPITAIGEQFDPRRHDAIARAPSRDVSPGTVLNEVQTGYLVGDRLLRPSSVIVAETPEPAARTVGS